MYRNFSFFFVFLKNRNISSKIKISEVTDYAALKTVVMFILLWCHTQKKMLKDHKHFTKVVMYLNNLLRSFTLLKKR